MATERRGPTLHDGTRRSAHVGGQGMGALVIGIACAEDVLQGKKPHRSSHVLAANGYRLFLKT